MGTGPAQGAPHLCEEHVAREGLQVARRRLLQGEVRRQGLASDGHPAVDCRGHSKGQSPQCATLPRLHSRRPPAPRRLTGEGPREDVDEAQRALQGLVHHMRHGVCKGGGCGCRNDEVTSC